MQIRKILIPLVGGDSDQLGLEQGLTLAWSMGAHCDAIFVRQDPKTAVPYLGLGAEDFRNVRDEYRRYAEQTGKRAAAHSLRQFEAKCDEHRLKQAEEKAPDDRGTARWVEVVGNVMHRVTDAAKLCDLTVFGSPLTDHHRFVPNLFETTLLASGRPLLLSPGKTLTFPPRCVAIAWDGSVPCVHAVTAAMDFLENAARVHVFSVEELWEESADPQELLEYLAYREVNAEAAVIPRGQHDVGQAILAKTRAMDADLLVAGGYAHNRFGEAIFGGTTRYLARHADIPILVMH